MKYVVIILATAFSFSSFAQKIIVQNFYYPKPGKFEEVLALRIQASKLLKEFGFSSGKVLVNREKEDEIAPIIWLSEYESSESLKKEMNSWTSTQEKRFEKEILSKMKILTKGFKRKSSYVIY